MHSPCKSKISITLECEPRNPNFFNLMIRTPNATCVPSFNEIGGLHVNMFPRKSVVIRHVTILILSWWKRLVLEIEALVLLMETIVEWWLNSIPMVIDMQGIERRELQAKMIIGIGNKNTWISININMLESWLWWVLELISIGTCELGSAEGFRKRLPKLGFDHIFRLLTFENSRTD